jgi:hypothetical protein
VLKNWDRHFAIAASGWVRLMLLGGESHFSTVRAASELALPR